MPDKIKPCPFCGGVAEYEEARYGVVCQICGTIGPEHGGLTREIQLENCIEAWNDRADIKE